MLRHVPLQLPEPDESQQHQVREQERREGRRPEDELVEPRVARRVPVGRDVVIEAEQADRPLQQQDDEAKAQVATADRRDEDREEEADSQGAGDDGYPFTLVEKAVLSVVGEAEDEVPEEAAQGHEQYPARPFLGL